MSSNDDLMIGVIGAGGRGALAWDAHRPGKGSRVVVGCDVVDRSIARAKERFRERFGEDLPIVGDYREVLDRDDIDAVFVTSPDYLHEEHAAAALDAGKHVYLEKPMAITIEGCDHILRAARDSGKRLYLGHNMRHLDFTRKMKALIDGGAIGEPKVGWCRHFVSYGGDAYFKDWHAERRYSTGLLLQKAAHDIDILHWLLGAYTTRVNAMGALTLYDQITDRHAPDDAPPWPPSTSPPTWPPLSQTRMNPVIDVEDVSMMLMQLEHGRLASYQQCHYTPDAWRNYTIIGTEGRVENFGDEPGNAVVRLWNRRVPHNPHGDEEYPIPPASGEHGGADPRIVAEFVRYAREGGRIATSAVAARNSVAAGYMATESLRNGGVPMDVPPVDAGLAAYFDPDTVRP